MSVMVVDILVANFQLVNTVTHGHRCVAKAGAITDDRVARLMMTARAVAPLQQGHARMMAFLTVVASPLTVVISQVTVVISQETVVAPRGTVVEFRATGGRLRNCREQRENHPYSIRRKSRVRIHRHFLIPGDRIHKKTRVARPGKRVRAEGRGDSLPQSLRTLASAVDRTVLGGPNT